MDATMPTDDEINEAFCNGASFLSLILYRGGVRDWEFAGGKDEVERAYARINRTWEAWAKAKGRKLTS